MGVETGCQLRWKEISASHHWGLLGRGIVSPPARDPSPVGFSGPILHGPGHQQESVLGLLGERKGTGADGPPAALNGAATLMEAFRRPRGSPNAPPPPREPGLSGFAVLVRTFFISKTRFCLPSRWEPPSLSLLKPGIKRGGSVNCKCGAVVQPCVNWMTGSAGWGREC